MPEAREQAKTRLIQAVADGLEPDVGAFARDVFARGAAEDLVGYTAADLAAIGPQREVERAPRISQEQQD